MGISFEAERILDEDKNSKYVLYLKVEEKINVFRNTSIINVTGHLKGKGEDSRANRSFKWPNAGVMSIYWKDDNEYPSSTLLLEHFFGGAGITPDGNLFTETIEIKHKTDGSLKGYIYLNFSPNWDVVNPQSYDWKGVPLPGGTPRDEQHQYTTISKKTFIKTDNTHWKKINKAYLKKDNTTWVELEDFKIKNNNGWK